MVSLLKFNRSIADKSIGVNEPARPAGHHHESHSTPAATAAVPKATTSSTNPFKALSPMCELRQGNSIDFSSMRLKLSKEEIDVINSGGYEDK